MRTVAALLVWFFVFAASAFSQSAWQKLDAGLAPNSSVPGITGAAGLALGSVTGDPLNKAVRSTDSGKSWGPLSALPPAKLKSLSSAFLYGVRGDSVMTSSNQGINWTPQRPSLSAVLADVHFINSTQSWAVGTTAVGDTPVVALTTNAWQSVNRRDTLPADSVVMLSVQFVDNNTGFALGRSTKSADANAALFFRTTDGGANWTRRGSLPDTCPSVPFLAADFLDGATGWAILTCVPTDKIYKTTDGGQNWSPQYPSSTYRFFAIDAVNASYVWVVGSSGLSNGLVIRTSDGGANWNIESVPPSGILRSVSMLSTANGYASGDASSGSNGTVLVYSPPATDVSGGRSNRPQSFELSQNYPNPFNGQTRIVFTLQKSQPVSLTIYNILGQPVKKLVEGLRPAGKNEVSWDGSSESGSPVPSGVYLYKLATPDEKQIRKMVLLK